MKHLCMFVLLTTLIVTPVWAGINYYVDKDSVHGTCNDGNQGTVASAPKCSLVAMYTRTSPTLQPGDTVYLAQGTYSEDIGHPNAVPPGGAPGNNITFTTYPGDTTATIGHVDLNGPCPPNETKALHLTFRNLKVFAPGRSNGIATLSCLDYSLGNYDAGHIFEDVEVTQWGPTEGEGIAVNGNNMVFRRMNVHYDRLVIDTNARQHGFYITGSNNLIEDSNIYLNPSYGIQVYSSLGCSGLNPSNNNVIRNNRLWHNGADLNEVGTSNSGGIVIAPGANNKVYNNLVYDMTHGTAIDIGNHCTDCQVYNNTLYNISNSAMTPGRGDPPPNCADLQGTTHIHSNIMSNIGGIPMDIKGSALYDIHHNLCFNASGVGCDLIGNPMFADVNAAGLAKNLSILSNSNARNRVAAVSGSCATTTDFAKTIRPQTPLGGSSTPCDIGAYEYNEGNVVTPVSGNPMYISTAGGNDSNTCADAENSTTPKLTITNALANCGGVPGKRYILRSGTYAEKIDTAVTPITGGNGPSLTTATTIETYPGEDVTLALPSGQQVLVFLQNSGNDKFIVFKGTPGHPLVLDGMNRASSNVIAMLPGTNNIMFQDFEAKNTVGGFECVYGAGSSNITFTATAGIANDSSIHNCGTSGIAVDDGSSNWTVERAMIYSNGANGINHKSGSFAGLTVKESTVRNNVGKGVVIGTSTGFVVQNSLMYSNGGIGLHLATGAVSPKVYNTTITGNTGNGYQCDVGVTSAELKNSIVFGNTAGNLVNNCTAVVQANLTTDPSFVNSGTNDYHLADGSSGIDAGATLLSIVLDRDNVVRPVGPNYDIGAYERGQATPPVTGDVTVFKLAPKQNSLFFSRSHDDRPQETR